jgi:hypothetical protein
VKSWLSRAKARLSFANVTAALALFVALGGTSYAAATLPFNSVGKGQIKPNAVGKSEAASNSIGTSELRNSGVAAADIKTGAVGPSEVRPNAIDSDELADKGIKSADIADDAKAELTAANGVTFRAAVKGDGTGAVGNAKAITRTALGVYSVDLGKDVSACQPDRRRRHERGRVHHRRPGRQCEPADRGHVQRCRSGGRPLVQPARRLLIGRRGDRRPARGAGRPRTG